MRKAVVPLMIILLGMVAIASIALVVHQPRYPSEQPATVARYNPGDPTYPNKVMDRYPSALQVTPSPAKPAPKPKRTLASQFPTWSK